MRTFVRRLALLAALGACVAATVSVSADALPIPEAGAKTGHIARSLAYVQPLNEQESGIALSFGCDFEYGGAGGRRPPPPRRAFRPPPPGRRPPRAGRA